MDRAEFKRQVNASVAPELRGSWWVRMAVDQTLEEHKVLYSYMVADVVRLVGSLRDKHPSPELSDGDEGTNVQVTPADLIESRLLADKIASWTRALRREGFGCDEPPFETVEKAAEWIKSRSKADLCHWRESQECIERGKAIDEIGRLQRKHKIDVDIKVAYHLPYHAERDGFHVDIVDTVPGTFLEKLARETKSAFEKIGVDQDALVVHVLTGLTPIRPKVRSRRSESIFRLPNGEQLISRREAITFYEGDLKSEQVARRYQASKRYLHGQGAMVRGLKLWETEFLNLVNEMGGWPKSNMTAFWESAQGRWNHAYGNLHHFGTWQGVRKKFKELNERLGYPSPPDGRRKS